MHELHNKWYKLFIILFNIIQKLLLDINKIFFTNKIQNKKIEYKNI